MPEGATVFAAVSAASRDQCHDLWQRDALTMLCLGAKAVMDQQPPLSRRKTPYITHHNHCSAAALCPLGTARLIPSKWKGVQPLGGDPASTAVLPGQPGARAVTRSCMTRHGGVQETGALHRMRCSEQGESTRDCVHWAGGASTSHCRLSDTGCAPQSTRSRTPWVITLARCGAGGGCALHCSGRATPLRVAPRGPPAGAARGCRAGGGTAT